MHSIRGFILAVLVIVSQLSAVQHPESGVLTVRITAEEHSGGKAIVRLFREVDDIPKKPWLQRSGEFSNNMATVSIDSLPYGHYALIAFADDNANGELDHSWGLPSEPIGFSNGWELSLFSGMPTFRKLAFTFSPQSDSCAIALH